MLRAYIDNEFCKFSISSSFCQTWVLELDGKLHALRIFLSEISTSFPEQSVKIAAGLRW